MVLNFCPEGIFIEKSKLYPLCFQCLPIDRLPLAVLLVNLVELIKK